MKSVGVFVDVANIYYHSKRKFDKKINYKKLLDYIKTVVPDSFIYRTIAYGLQIENEANSFITCLKHYGYETKYRKIGKERIGKELVKWNLDIALDIVRIISKLDVVIIGSCDLELIPLIEWIKESGIPVIIIACLVSKPVKEVCNDWVEIDSSFLEEKEKEKEKEEEKVIKNNNQS